MRNMHKFKHALLRCAAAAFAAMLLTTTGCEPDMDEDYAGVDAYFEANPYSGHAHPEPGVPDLMIEPAAATVSIVGRTVVFEGRGGQGPYTWSVANSANGRVDVLGWSDAVYTCVRVGNNNVIVRDNKGHSAAAEITPVLDEMTIQPASVTLSADELYAAFSVAGGTPPYTWSVSHAGMGTISYSADTSHAAGYTAVAGAYGVNVVTAMDSEGRTVSATITRSQEEE